MKTESPAPEPEEIIIFWIAMVLVTLIAGLYVGSWILERLNG